MPDHFTQNHTTADFLDLAYRVGHEAFDFYFPRPLDAIGVTLLVNLDGAQTGFVQVVLGAIEQGLMGLLDEGLVFSCCSAVLARARFLFWAERMRRLTCLRLKAC